RVAAVSSFGIGGTNSHLVLEAGELVPLTASEPAADPASPPTLLTLSSSSAAGLRADADRVADYLASHPESYLQVLRHLQAGRPTRRWRMAANCPDAASAVAWLRSATGVLVTPGQAGESVEAQPAGSQQGKTPPGTLLAEAQPDQGQPLEALAAAWLAGTAIRWPAGPAQPPWDFPPPAFELADFDFGRAAPAAVRSAPSADERLPEDAWLHQPQWVRWRRAATGSIARTSRLLVTMTAEPLPAEALRPFDGRYSRVVRVSAGDAFGKLDQDAYQVDPVDPASLARLLQELSIPGQDGIDWLHALPLSVDGPVGHDALGRARWACLDTPAALLQAVDGLPAATGLRPWWLSYQGQPVDGSVARPEFGLLAGACEVAPQECAVDGRWLDLPCSDPADWAAPLAAMLAETGAGAGAGAAIDLPRRLALRQGYWWQPALLPVTPPEQTAPGHSAPGTRPVDGGVYLVLGGTGGIGSSIAGWLLAEADCRVILLARKATFPASLAHWADRVELIEADLAQEPADTVLARRGRRFDRQPGRLDGVVHAAGAAGGSLIARRDAATMRQATAAKLQGCLLVEGLIQRYQPAFAAYCSSMSALFGGIGQLDYAAANGLTDGFARHRGGAGESTVRLGIDWDIWSEVGMARQALRTDARHQAHLAVGLGVAEGQRVFARALRLQLPQLLVSTTALEQAGNFYAPLAGAAPADRATAPTAATASMSGTTMTAAASSTSSAAEQLTDCLCRWLGVDRLDPAASLYDLGADSLVLLDLIGEVKRRFGVDIELARLSHRASLSEVLAQFEAVSGAAQAVSGATQAVSGATQATGAAGEATESGEPVPLEVWQAGTGSDLLCLIHPVGGDIQAYRSLVSALDPRLTVCLIADPALYRPELPPWPLAERARRYHEALLARFPRAEWRWRLGGWSFGAWVALAMAAESEAAGRPAAGLYLLDPPPPGSGTALQAYDERQLRTVFALELGQGGQPTLAAEAAAYTDRLARCCRVNLASMAGYELPPLVQTPSELWLASQPVAGLPEQGSTPERRQLWQAQLPGLISCCVIDTTHDGIVRPPVVQAVAETINAASLPVLENC
ncbi:MAG: hypothetical protein QOI26_49, partial [Pseudonocardiales bacterium]|nr:hypothetical protein [Pseudonocardiales bacterium]